MKDHGGHLHYFSLVTNDSFHFYRNFFWNTIMKLPQNLSKKKCTELKVGNNHLHWKKLSIPLVIMLEENVNHVNFTFKNSKYPKSALILLFIDFYHTLWSWYLFVTIWIINVSSNEYTREIIPKKRIIWISRRQKFFSPRNNPWKFI